ncbi:MAG: discoidin domain-containing protein, partial [Sphingobacterium sp.]
YSTPMTIESTKWLDGYNDNDPVISDKKEVELLFEPGTFKEVKLHIKTPQGSNAILDLLISELGIIRDVTNFDNLFTISHENTGGPDGDEGSKKLIDNNLKTKVFLGGTGNDLTWQFEYFVPQIVNGYSMTSGNDAPERDPKRWKVEGSQDGETWTIIDERSDQAWETRNLSRTFTYTNKTEYKFYKFSMTELTSGTNFQMSEVRLLEIPQ